MPKMPSTQNSGASAVSDRSAALTQIMSSQLSLPSSGCQIDVSSLVGSDAISVRSSTGKLRLRINIEGDAVTIESFDGRNVLSINGPLVLQADSVELSAKQHLAITSGGAVSIQAGGAISIGAASLELTAHRGDVAINANDDVRMEAERIRMNA